MRRFPLSTASRIPSSPANLPQQGWRQAWRKSLRLRLLLLGLVPLLVMFPLVIVIMLLVASELTTSMLHANLRSNLAGTRNSLQLQRTDAEVRISQMVKSQRLVQTLESARQNNDPRELNQLLRSTAEGSGLDYLLIAAADGQVLASSTGVPAQTRLPDSHVIRQALIGVSNSAFERFDASQMMAFSPAMAAHAAVPESDAPGTRTETRGLLVNAAAHFPLSKTMPDAILLGGVLLNRNFTLIDHIRDIIYPVGSLPDDAEGVTSLYADGTSVVVSRLRKEGQQSIGVVAPAGVYATVMERGETWLGSVTLGGRSYLAGFEPLRDGAGQRVGMISVAFPDAPYARVKMLMLGGLALLMALVMWGISLVFLRAGHQLTQRLAVIGQAMALVREGDRGVRVGAIGQPDEIGQLGQDFDELLDTIERQEQEQRAAQQTIADEALRRRALFESERDGVVVLQADGKVLEANPKAAQMLGYSLQELLTLRVQDWEARLGVVELLGVLDNVGPDGAFFETEHRRKDGSTYCAEVSMSRARWDDQDFIFLLQRDITARKAVEAELDSYREGLVALVNQRTADLHERSEQLQAIFALSPDGFVSFDRQRRVAFVNEAFCHMTGMVATDVLGMDEATFSAALGNRSVAHAPFPGISALRAAAREATLAAAAGLQGKGRGKRQLFELTSPANRVLETGLRLSETSNVSQLLHLRDVTHEVEVDRMKSEFLSTAAHELRTPMTSIHGYTELLLVRDYDAPKRKKVLETILKQSSLMIAIINELLDLARIEDRQGADFVLERLSLRDIVEQSVAEFKPPEGRTPPRTDPEASGADGADLLVTADRNKARQVVLNLLSNAYKYSPGGGEVCIRYLSEAPSGIPRYGIEISDHGMGMTPEQVHRVWERFYRADASGNIPGSGLGMSIVKEIVELHGGQVDIASQAGVGTQVTLWLPPAHLADSNFAPLS